MESLRLCLSPSSVTVLPPVLIVDDGVNKTTSIKKTIDSGLITQSFPVMVCSFS